MAVFCLLLALGDRSDRSGSEVIESVDISYRRRTMLVSQIFHTFVGTIRQLGYCDANTLIGSEPFFLMSLE